MADIEAIDTMCRPVYSDPDVAKRFFEEFPELHVMADTTFAGIKARLDLDDDENWRVLSYIGNDSIDETIQEMDDVGVERLFVDQGLLWSRDAKKVVKQASVDYLIDLRERADGRVVPGVGYNPFSIEESLDRIERAVRDHDFKYVWFHPMAFGLRPDDAKCYPLYSKCVELDVPVCYQTGQSAEQLTSEPGHPMYADEVAMDFPDLTLVLTHGGWPWSGEWCSMLWRHPNVYGNIGAYFPSFLPERQVEFIDSGRIRNKVFWATNGIGLERHKQEFLDLDVREKTQRRVLRENALEVFDI